MTVKRNQDQKTVKKCVHVSTDVHCLEFLHFKLFLAKRKVSSSVDESQSLKKDKHSFRIELRRGKSFVRDRS